MRKKRNSFTKIFGELLGITSPQGLEIEDQNLDLQMPEPWKRKMPETFRIFFFGWRGKEGWGGTNESIKPLQQTITSKFTLQEDLTSHQRK